MHVMRSDVDRACRRQVPLPQLWGDNFEMQQMQKAEQPLYLSQLRVLGALR
jgi:hypothetical protein